MEKVLAELKDLDLENCTMNTLRTKLHSARIIYDQYTDMEQLLRLKENRIRDLERENEELRRKLSDKK